MSDLCDVSEGDEESKSYNFCFKQLTMNLIYISSLAIIVDLATIKH